MPRVCTPLKLYLLRRGLTLRELSRSTGISENRLSLIANNLRQARPDEMTRIADVLGLSPYQLFAANRGGFGSEEA